MMMMKTAGGPATPVWARSTKAAPLPPWMWAGIALSVAAHVGVGVWLVAQRWTPPAAFVTPDETPPMVIDLSRPEAPEPEPLPPTTARAAPPTVLNDTPLPTTPTDVVAFTPRPDAVVGQGPVIDLTPAPDPATTGSATTPTDAPAAPGVITNPDWVRRPTGAALMRAYPPNAARDGVAGHARLSCSVRVDGTLTGCAVVDESPVGAGFGRAAMRLSRDFRMSPRTVDGRPVEGARVNTTLRFTLPQD